MEVAEDGSISVTVAREMSRVFDAMPSPSGASRKKITLSCAVWGSFPDESLPPIHANLQIEILDDICWVSKGYDSNFYVQDSSATSQASCRANCRRDASCPSYWWFSGSPGVCRRYTHPTSSPSIYAFSKITNCTAESTCLEVSTDKWYQSGLYCPVAPDLFRGDVLYLKQGATKEETLYLARYSSSVDGPVGGCSNGNWILRQAAPEKDYIQMESGEVELGGPVLRCLTGGVSFGLASCPAPNISVPDEGYPPMVVDDPHSSEPADYWLHPCECAPTAWGMDKPVNPESFESVPGKSNNQFIPPHLAACWAYWGFD